MKKGELSSPILLKYLRLFEQNRTSRVFAPLAEGYRALGRVEKALEVLKEGLKHNPTYVMGYLGLASCYHDLNQHTLAYATLRPLVVGNRDNLRLQKLFATICLEMGLFEEALETYKYLLFVNPKDSEAILQVKHLEDLCLKVKETKPAINEDTKGHEDDFTIEQLNSSAYLDGDDWVQMNMTSNDQFLQSDHGDAIDTEYEKDETEELQPDEREILTDISKIALTTFKIQPTPDMSFEEEFEEHDEHEEYIESEEIPVITHTLVDLYCQQGLFSKAKEVLQKILEANPDDLRTIKRAEEIDNVISTMDYKKNFVANEHEGHTALTSLLDRKLGMNKIDDELPTKKTEKKTRKKTTINLQNIYELTEKKYSLFLKKLNERKFATQKV